MIGHGTVDGAPDVVTPSAPTSIAGASMGDRVYRVVTTAFAIFIPLLLLLITLEVVVAAWPALARFGPAFLTSSAWE